MTPLDRPIALLGRRVAPGLASLFMVLALVVGSAPVPAAADGPAADSLIAQTTASTRSPHDPRRRRSLPADFSTVSVGPGFPGTGFSGPVQVTNAADGSHRRCSW